MIISQLTYYRLYQIGDAYQRLQRKQFYTHQAKSCLHRNDQFGNGVIRLSKQKRTH